MAVPKFIIKIAAKRAEKKARKLAASLGKQQMEQQLYKPFQAAMKQVSGLQKTSKKEIKDKLRKRTEEQKIKVAEGSNNDFVKAEASYTKKDIRKEARNIKRAGLDGPKRTGPIKKQIPANAKGLLNMVQSEKGKDVVKERFGYTQMPDGNPITRKCSYNSKKKKK